MKLVVLGSGKSNISAPFRNTAAHLVVSDNGKILLDCSDGTRGQLAKVGVNSFDIDAVFFSHFHPDHFSPNCLIQDYLVRKLELPNEELRLQLYGPKGLSDKIIKSWDAAWGDGKFQEFLLPNVDLHIQELDDQESIQLGSLTVTAHKVKHTDMEALAFRVEDEGKVLAYSGDATICEGLTTAAQESDIFLCEAAIPPTGPKSNDLHVSAAGAAQAAKQASAKKLVITHYSAKADDMIQAVKNESFEGDVEIADDLSEFDI